jgi:hypothetical protein
VNDDLPMSAKEVRREIRALRELLEEKINSLDNVMAARLNAMDRALELEQTKTGLVEIKTQFEDMVQRVTELEKRK